MTSTTMFYYTKVMTDLFLDVYFKDTRNNFRGAMTMVDFWRVSLDVGAAVSGRSKMGVVERCKKA